MPGGIGSLVGLREGRGRWAGQAPTVQGRAVGGALEAWREVGAGGSHSGKKLVSQVKKKIHPSSPCPALAQGMRAGRRSLLPSGPAAPLQSFHRGPTLLPRLPPSHLLMTGQVSSAGSEETPSPAALGSVGLWAPESLAWLQAQARQAAGCHPRSEAGTAWLDLEPLGPVPLTSCLLQLPEGAWGTAVEVLRPKCSEQGGLVFLPRGICQSEWREVPVPNLGAGL